MATTFNPYDDDPFGINNNHHHTPTINTTNSFISPRPTHAFTSSPNNTNTTTNQQSSSSNYFLNSVPTPTITSTPTYQTTPRRSTIGFEDDFSAQPGMMDTSLTIESSDFLLSLGTSPSHRHTLSGASTTTINTNSGSTIGGGGNGMNPYFSPQMQQGNIGSSGFISPRSTGSIKNPSTSPISSVNTTPRQSITSTPITPRESISEIQNNFVSNPVVNSIKSTEKEVTVKRRSRTMFESNENRIFTKDLLDFSPFTQPQQQQAEPEKSKPPVMIAQQNEPNSPLKTRPKSMKMQKSTDNLEQPSPPVISRESLIAGSDNKITVPEAILMICLSDSGIVKSYISDQIEEICMMGIFCELIIQKKLTTRPLRDVQGKFGLLVIDQTPIPIANKRDTPIIEIMNEVLALLAAIIKKCPAKDVNQFTIKDYVKILCSGKKMENIIINKIASVLNRIGKQLSERKIVDYKKTLFLFLSLPIKDKIERDRCLNELVVFLKMLRSEMDANAPTGLEEGALLAGSLTFDTCTERMLKNRHDFVIYSLLGLFTMNHADILTNDIIKSESDWKPLKELSFSIFNINTMGSFSKKKVKDTDRRRPSLIDEAMMDIVESDDDDDNMLNTPELSHSTSNIALNGEKRPNINLTHFPEGLNYFEEIALHLKRCIYGGCKQ